MKRFAAAAAVAVGLHALLLTLDIDRRGAGTPRGPAPEAVTVVLRSAPPRVVEPRRSSPPPEPPLAAPARDPAHAAAAPVAPAPVPAAAPKPVKAVKKSAPAPRPRATGPQPMPPEARLPQPPAVSAPAEEPAPGSGGRAPIAPADEAAPGNRAAPPPQGPAEPPALKEAVPEYGKNRAAEYPRRARQLGFEGVVVLEVLVNPAGGVDEVRLFSSSGHAILDESAARSVRAWTFRPARRGEQAIPMWVRVPIRFELGAP